jgi:hypothetical protein
MGGSVWKMPELRTEVAPRVFCTCPQIRTRTWRNSIVGWSKKTAELFLLGLLAGLHSSARGEMRPSERGQVMTIALHELVRGATPDDGLTDGPYPRRSESSSAGPRED